MNADLVTSYINRWRLLTACHQFTALQSNEQLQYFDINRQEGLAVASIARDDPSTLPGDDPSSCARIHRDHNCGKLVSEFET